MSQDGDQGRINRELEARVNALESLLIEKSLVDRQALQAILDLYETRIGPRNGARVVARAWVDPLFKARLLSTPDEAISSMGYTGRQGEHVVVVENTPRIHNLVVCTLCSCYPWPLLGLPPGWYKSAPYRARAVIDPRGVLADFGLHLPADTQIQVWDSNAEVRYLVLPMQPAGTAHLSEEALAELISRNAMIGTDIVRAPGPRSEVSP
jgi:nitrile hydratase subunit alpha